jgi:mRNA-degrading endonuclease RelE of RelBE toxin-antitoxin system
MEFIEAPAFTRHLSDYLADDEYREVQKELATNPELGDLMPGTGGFRKMRCRDPRRSKGRRSGLRIIYYYFPTDRQISLMTLYDKDEASDLTPKQKRALKSAIETELRARQAAKLARREEKSRRRQL